MIYSRTEASNRDGENDVVEPVERRERERERERERPSAAASFAP